MPKYSDAVLVFKVGQMVHNERLLRWGQIQVDNKKYQHLTGDPGYVGVYDITTRGPADWPISDLSVVVERGRQIHFDPLKVSHFQRLRSGAADPDTLGNVAAEAAEHSPIVAKMCAILDRCSPGWHRLGNEGDAPKEWRDQIQRRIDADAKAADRAAAKEATRG